MFFDKIFQLYKGQEKINLDDLRQIFDSQKETLIKRGIGATLGLDDFAKPDAELYLEKETENAWQRLKEATVNISFKPFGKIPLLLVMHFPNIKEGIEKIQGHTELDLQKIKSEPSKNFCDILLDVEDGQKMIAKSPKDALKKLEKENRQALNINESTALLTHYPDILKNHYVISAGSFYTTKDNESLPLLWLLDEHGNPELHYAWFHIAHGSYGTASYTTRI